MTTARRRPALIALVVIAALGCLGLGWWQWTRFEAVDGTGQNLGYALQWPLFAGFVVYAYRRFVRLEQESDPEPQRDREPSEIPSDLLPARPVAPSEPTDPTLAEYNRYLAELYDNDRSPG